MYIHVDIGCVSVIFRSDLADLAGRSHAVMHAAYLRARKANCIRRATA